MDSFDRLCIAFMMLGLFGLSVITFIQVEKLTLKIERMENR